MSYRGKKTREIRNLPLEEGSDTLGLDDLSSSVEHTVVVNLLSRGHHHTTTDSVERVGSDTGTGGDSPIDSKSEVISSSGARRVGRVEKDLRHTNREGRRRGKIPRGIPS